MVPLNIQTTIDTELAALISDLAIALPPLTTAAYTVHAYTTRAGQGYVIHADVIISGVQHRKSVNVGPATWLTQTWRTTKVIKMS